LPTAASLAQAIAGVARPAEGKLNLQSPSQRETTLAP
jgi:hypothetical protein